MVLGDSAKFQFSNKSFFTVLPYHLFVNYVDLSEAILKLYVEMKKT